MPKIENAVNKLQIITKKEEERNGQVDGSMGDLGRQD